MRAAWVLVVLATLSLPSVPAQSDPADRCAAAKIRAASRKAAAKLRCQAAAAVVGGNADPACLARAETKFSAAWQKIEAAGGCASTGDQGTVENDVDTFVGRVVTVVRNFQCTTTTTYPPCVNQLGGTCSFFNIGCPGGQTCTDDGGGGCTCVGAPPPCASAGSSFCSVGVCPPGQTCTVLQGLCGPIGCGCR